MAHLTDDMNQTELLWHLMGAGDENVWDSIKNWANDGGNILTTSGSEIQHTEIIAGDTAVTTTTEADLAGWTLPTLTYTGRPIYLDLNIPAITVSGALTFTVVVRDSDDVRIMSQAVATASSSDVRDVKMATRLPKTPYPLEVGDEIDLRVRAFVSTGTATIRTYFNNAIFGSTAAYLRAERK